MTGTASSSALAPYVPRLVRAWSEEPGGPRARTLDGSLVSVDISGFTALAEQLAAKGKAGAEELVGLISAVFDDLIGVAERHGGDVLKFRGDALLLFFGGERHAERACGAASDMQWTIETVGKTVSSAGAVELRMSVGVHSGACHFFLTEVATPGADRLRPGGDACVRARGPGVRRRDRGQPGNSRCRRPGLARRGARRRAADDPPRARRQHDPAAARRIGPRARAVRARRRSATTSPSRAARPSTATSCVAFVKVSGTDDLIATAGPEELLGRLDVLAAAVDAACANYGITWLESDIDVNACKLYLTAGAPSSTGDDMEGMLRALREIVSADIGLDVRAGVHRGPVFTGDIGAVSRRTYAVLGDAVNLAARLTGRAQPGDVLATADVLDRTRTTYATDREPLLVKGKERAVMAHMSGNRPAVARSHRSTRSRSSAATPSSTCCAERSTLRACASCR